jgi:uncharacterized OB-fold protein
MATLPFTVASFNQFLREKKLMASRCPQCNALYLPPRAICPKCHGDQLEWVETSGKGKLAAFTSVYVGPTAMIAEGFDRNNPYVTGIVELDEGVRISARILGVDARHPEQIKIGTPMTVDFVERGEGDKKQTFLAFQMVSG